MFVNTCKPTIQLANILLKIAYRYNPAVINTENDRPYWMKLAEPELYVKLFDLTEQNRYPKYNLKTCLWYLGV